MGTEQRLGGTLPANQGLNDFRVENANATRLGLVWRDIVQEALGSQILLQNLGRFLVHTKELRYRQAIALENLGVFNKLLEIFVYFGRHLQYRGAVSRRNSIIAATRTRTCDRVHHKIISIAVSAKISLNFFRNFQFFAIHGIEYTLSQGKKPTNIMKKGFFKAGPVKPGMTQSRPEIRIKKSLRQSGSRPGPEPRSLRSPPRRGYGSYRCKGSGRRT